MAAVAISARGLTKFYGQNLALDRADLDVHAGEIFGFLGPNGAGKTTTIRILLDLIRPSSGKASVLGLDPQHDSVAIRDRIGYLPGEVSVYERMTGAEFLDYAASFHTRRDDALRARLAERLGIDLGKRLGRLSKGMKQKVAIIQALMHDTELLILDEPTSGLDPLAQHEFYDILREEQARGKTVFMSSHNLAEVERVCARVAIIRAGRVILTGDVQELKRRKKRVIDVSFTDDVAEEELVFPNVSDLVAVRNTGKHFRFAVVGDLNPILGLFARHQVQGLSVEDASLEDIFMEYYSQDEDEKKQA